MQINLKQMLKGKNGEDAKDDAGAATSLEDVAYVALTTLSNQEGSVSRDEKMRRGRLAQRILAATDGVIDLKAEEITTIKNCIGYLYGPWVVVQTEDMLEAKS